MLRQLGGNLVDFCRRAEGAEDVIFARSIQDRPPGARPKEP